MPELPEVETTRRHVAAAITGRSVRRVEVARDRMVRRHQRPADFAERLTGSRIERVDRIGKFMLAHTDDDLVWVTHLGMSGRVSLAAASEPRSPHTNVVVGFDRGPEFRLVDPRTFGFVAAWTPEEIGAGAMAAMGRDALEDLPPTRWWMEKLQGRTAPIKALLLDQRLVAGLGNIYADEILHRAAVHPERPGGSLTREEVVAIRAAVRPVLRAGLRHGGTSLDDLAYLLPDGRAGDYVRRLKVYGRTDAPCRRCGTPIERIVVRQRSSHFCPTCQT